MDIRQPQEGIDANTMTGAKIIVTKIRAKSENELSGDPYPRKPDLGSKIHVEEFRAKTLGVPLETHRPAERKKEGLPEEDFACCLTGRRRRRRRRGCGNLLVGENEKEGAPALEGVVTDHGEEIGGERRHRRLDRGRRGTQEAGSGGNL
ncbi:hypothetical protein KSP39_PZI005821 [Platanthera zijinensis]|uniref:Uncharacterized protein n=1 Tax=Platanthera zijinensis TaxID=2320716 RepID=A0AAP0GAL3_9ASPA